MPNPQNINSSGFSCFWHLFILMELQYR